MVVVMGMLCVRLQQHQTAAPRLPRGMRVSDNRASVSTRMQRKALSRVAMSVAESLALLRCQGSKEGRKLQGNLPRQPFRPQRQAGTKAKVQGIHGATWRNGPFVVTTSSLKTSKALVLYVPDRIHCTTIHSFATSQ